MLDTFSVDLAADMYFLPILLAGKALILGSLLKEDHFIFQDHIIF